MYFISFSNMRQDKLRDEKELLDHQSCPPKKGHPEDQSIELYISYFKSLLPRNLLDLMKRLLENIHCGTGNTNFLKLIQKCVKVTANMMKIFKEKRTFKALNTYLCIFVYRTQHLTDVFSNSLLHLSKLYKRIISMTCKKTLKFPQNNYKSS